MTNDYEIKKLLSQSKEAYAKYVECNKVDDLAEAGELLWECLKANIAQVTNTKTDNVNELRRAAAPMGEIYNQLFFHCNHFHSLYLGDGVSNDFAAEKKLYQKSVRSLEKIIKNKVNCAKNRKRLENATEAI